MRTFFYLILWLIMLYLLLVVGIAIYICTLSFHELMHLLYFLEYGDPNEEGHEEKHAMKFKQKQIEEGEINYG